MQPELDHQLDVEESEQGAQLLDAELLQLERSNQAEINANERRELEAREERARLERRGADIKQRLEHNQRIAALDQRQRRERHSLAPHSQAGIAARRDAADLGQLSSDMAELRAFRERDTNQRELEHQRHAPYGQQQQPSLPPIAAHTEQSPYTTGLPDYRTTGLQPPLLPEPQLLPQPSHALYAAQELGHNRQPSPQRYNQPSPQGYNFQPHGPQYLPPNQQQLYGQPEVRVQPQQFAGQYGQYGQYGQQQNGQQHGGGNGSTSRRLRSNR
jgi:hypothetical protein